MKLSNWTFAVAALVAFPVAILNAATCSVPSSGYPTIQAAVNDITCATINVAPGVYTENVTVPRAVVLNGAQAGQPIGSRVSGGPAESVLTGADPAGSVAVLTITASNVTVDGFTISDAVTANAAVGIDIKPVS